MTWGTWTRYLSYFDGHPMPIDDVTLRKSGTIGVDEPEKRRVVWFAPDVAPQEDILLTEVGLRGEAIDFRRV